MAGILPDPEAHRNTTLWLMWKKMRSPEIGTLSDSLGEAINTNEAPGVQVLHIHV